MKILVTSAIEALPSTSVLPQQKLFQGTGRHIKDVTDSMQSGYYPSEAAEKKWKNSSMSNTTILLVLCQKDDCIFPKVSLIIFLLGIHFDFKILPHFFSLTNTILLLLRQHF